MKKSKKILLSTVCASSALLAIAPIVTNLSLQNSSNNTQNIINKETKDLTTRDSLPIWNLRVEGEIVKEDEYTVSVQTRYYRDKPEYYIESAYWEMSWDKRDWMKMTSFSEIEHNSEGLTFQRYTTGNYYIRKVIVWQHNKWWDRTERTTDPILIKRKLALTGTTRSSDEYIDFDFTFGVSSKNDLVKYILLETDEDGEQYKATLDKVSWSYPKDIGQKTKKENDFIFTKRISKDATKIKYYKLIFNSINSDGILQENYLRFNVIPKKVTPLQLYVNKINETDETATFDFSINANKGELVSYQLISINDHVETILESKDYAPIESFAEKNSIGYKITRSIGKLYSQKKQKYKIVANSKRTELGDFYNKAEYYFYVEPRINNKWKVISTKILNNTNAMSSYLALNGGYSRENIDRINSLPTFQKLAYFHNVFIYNTDFNKIINEIENIMIYLSRDNGSTITLGVVYFLKDDYIFEDQAQQLKQNFYEIKKI